MLRWWVTENTSVGWTTPHRDDISCAWSGHQTLLTGHSIMSTVNSAMAACKVESSVCSLNKGEPPPFFFKGCDPEQCRIKERENLLEVPPSHCINRQCGTTGSVIFQTLLQDNEGAKVASTTRAIQCTTWQLISQGRLINWPRCSENKEDILVAGKGQTLSPRGIQ